MRAVIFDCDGVLADSEGISAGVLEQMLAELGLPLGREAIADRFLGRTMKEELGWLSERTGVPLGADWLAEFQRRRNVLLRDSLQPIPGAVDAVRRIHAQCEGRIACASGGDRLKIELQLGRIGLLQLFEGRISSGYETEHSKPSPDVYLAAMALLREAPGACLAIEDSVPGVASAVAAGMRVYGYSRGLREPHVHALVQAGAEVVFADMGELPGLVTALMAQC